MAGSLSSMPGNVLSRRTFIASVAAVAGGLAVGVRFTGSKSRGSIVSGGAVEVFNWITIEPDNTLTIRIAQMEMGQGAMTSMAQLIGEELEADWSKVRTEFISIKKHVDRGRVYGRTETAGSAGVRLSEPLLRTCGAQIRTMLITAAAQRLGREPSEFCAHNSIIVHKPTGLQFTYGDVAAEAAKIPVPDPASVKLKDPAKWTLIGASVSRVDVPAKVNGTAIYGVDVYLPGMKYAAVVMSPVFGGRLISCDTREALSRPGVLKVIRIKGGRAGTEDAVAVVADHWWEAKAAVDSIPKKWDRDAHMRHSSHTILASLQSGLDAAPDKILRETGSVVAAMASAKTTIQAEYFVPYLEHATMEPMNCTARVTADSFDIWAPTQVPVSALSNAAKAARLKRSQGNLHITQMGGGFGRRQQSDFIVQAIEIAKRMVGVPIKVLWSRQDTIQHGFYRPAALSLLQGGIDSTGNVTAWSHRIVATSSERIRTQYGSDSLLYAIPNICVDFVVRPCSIPEGQMRGVAFATHCFMTQSFVDELARASGRDTYELQRSLLDPEKTPDTVPTPLGEDEYKETLSPRSRASRLRAVLDVAARKANWRTPLGPYRGRGLSVIEQANAFYAVVVEVTLDEKSWFRVDRVIVAGDPGFLVNPRNADAQVEGSVAFGLTAAIYGEITFREGGVTERNFNDYKMLRVDEMPEVETHWVLSRMSGWGGVGEPVVAAVIPALTNAIYDAGGPRVRSLPIKNHKIVPRA